MEEHERLALFLKRDGIDHRQIVVQRRHCQSSGFSLAQVLDETRMLSAKQMLFDLFIEFLRPCIRFCLDVLGQRLFPQITQMTQIKSNLPALF
jgi:hypothetical protein